ncbi:MAG: hypothetical protein LBC18_03125 [Opitutaceae bacterium]|nr:hypothetical protein [Opitutaceae bacterium]
MNTPDTTPAQYSVWMRNPSANQVAWVLRSVRNDLDTAVKLAFKLRLRAAKSQGLDAGTEYVVAVRKAVPVWGEWQFVVNPKLTEAADETETEDAE